MKGFRIILILAITTVLGCSGKNKSSKSRNFEIKTPEFDEVLVEIEATVNEIKYDEIEIKAPEFEFHSTERLTNEIRQKLYAQYKGSIVCEAMNLEGVTLGEHMFKVERGLNRKPSRLTLYKVVAKKNKISRNPLKISLSGLECRAFDVKTCSSKMKILPTGNPLIDEDFIEAETFHIGLISDYFKETDSYDKYQTVAKLYLDLSSGTGMLHTLRESQEEFLVSEIVEPYETRMNFSNFEYKNCMRVE